MLKNMLTAVSRILESKDTKEGTDLVVKVKCAKIMLDEIISGMGGEALPKVEALEAEAKPKVKPKTENEAKLPYKVLLSPDKKLLKIEGLPMNSLVVVDGVSMTHAQAIGKKFSKVSLP